MKTPPITDPFTVEICVGLLVARQHGICLFTLRLRDLPGLVLHRDRLHAQRTHGALTPLYRGDDAVTLLNRLTVALATVEKSRVWRRRLIAGVAALLAGGMALVLTLSLWAVLSPVDDRPSQARERVRINDRPGIKPLRSAVSAGGNPAAPDNWTLSASVRAHLPARLGHAASRGLFTVPLSTGHARTLYVFADPACINCQRMERHIETAAGRVNVVIFPVTSVGGTDSLTRLTPVLCLPAASRAGAWTSLFAADVGIAVPGQEAGHTADAAHCETATAALGVNDVAFRAYRLPGTPWILSDDGRYVPQAVLSSPSALDAFLETPAPPGASGIPATPTS